MPTALLSGHDVLIGREQHEEAQRIVEQTRDCKRLSFSVSLEDGSQVEVPQAFSRIIEQVIHTAASGGRMSFLAMPEELSTSAAANMLGVSRPTLMKFIAEGQIASRKEGSHARLKTDDVIEFVRFRAMRQAAAIDEMRTVSDQLGDE